MIEAVTNESAEGILTMSRKELSRMEVMERLDSKRMKQNEAAQVLRLTTRQVRRLQRLYRAQGVAGLVSRRRGRVSNHRLGADLRAQIVGLVAERYADFGPTLACEKLAEEHGLHLSVESLRQLMMAAGIWKARRARQPVVHQMRERRAARGELVQIDGSPHDWFEGRGPRCTLLVFIDDATGEILYLRFVSVEDTWNYFGAVHDYLLQHGKPRAFYSDKHGVFRVNAKDVQNGEAITQFGRALEELDIQLLCAHSPQAKGRVERMNQTLQDRLIKQMRLQGIGTMAKANAMLPAFIARLNGKFAVPARNPQDAHRPLGKDEQPEAILTLQSKRVLSKNLTLQYHNTIYQIQTRRPTYALRQAQVLVSEKRTGEVTISYKGKPLQYEIHTLQSTQSQIVDSKAIDITLRGSMIETRNNRSKAQPSHPWKRTFNPAIGKSQINSIR